jgi:DNA-directed RNA polymerase specialized sigma24 family protein
VISGSLSERHAISYGDRVPRGSTDEKLHKELHAVAKKAAASVSDDPDVIEGAANYAVAQFKRYKESISVDERARKRWVQVVATNHARRVGKQLHREIPVDVQGSEHRPTDDPNQDERVRKLIEEMRSGDRARLSSAVAIKVDFEKRWALLGGEARALLHAKYVEGYSTKEIARFRGLAPGTVDNKLSAAKANARELFDGLIEQLHGNWEDCA